MMFAFTVLCFSFFLSLVHASPLTKRDVFNPHITSPDANTEWPVGTQQTVTWNTADIPPDSQLTRPDGKVLLGHLGPTGGFNLDFEHPLAQGFKLRDGKVAIKVPNVAPRDDYIIVLMGDSGNASPAFAITRITGGGSNSSSSSKTPSPSSTRTSVSTSASRTTTATGTPNKAIDSPSTTSVAASLSSTLSLPIPITGTEITGGNSDTSTPTGIPTGSSSAPGPGSSSASSTSAAWSSHHFDSTKTFTIGIMSLALMLAM